MVHTNLGRPARSPVTEDMIGLRTNAPEPQRDITRTERRAHSLPGR